MNSSVLKLLITIFGISSTQAFSLWFGSSDYRDVSSPYGSPPVDYGECDWYDPMMTSNPQPLLPGMTSMGGGGLGYDYEAGAGALLLRGGGGYRSQPNLAYMNQNPFSSAPVPGSSFGNFDFMSSVPGEPYDANDLTAAHRTLPIGSYVTVINENNDRSVVVRIVDNRGPNVVGRVMTLSQAAFHQIADLDERTIPCYVSVK